MIYLFNLVLGKTFQPVFQIILSQNSKLHSKYNEVDLGILSCLKLKVQIPSILISSVLSIEDKRYYRHRGVDYFSITRSILNNFYSRRIEGASTITQQLVRIVTNEREIKYKRKIIEIILASSIDRKFTKDEILKAYLLHYDFVVCRGLIEFSEIEHYDLKRLSRKSSAEIAARIKYPILSSGNYLRFLKRVRTIEKLVNGADVYDHSTARSQW